MATKNQEGISLAIPVNMASFQKIAVTLGADVPLCVRGRHAVGKSEGVHQAAEQMFSDFYKDPENCAKMVDALRGERSIADRIAKTNGIWTYEMGIPVIERRLSQMTEGDIIGLPYQSTNGRGTSFKPCDWLINSCEFPALLFLDERNRALPGVKQAVFQLMDSKAFYGNVLHAETRIIVAENIGSTYEVNQTDPAEVSRAATVTLVPQVEEWIEYAKKYCNPALVDFIRQNPKNLEHNDEYEENKKYPDRRSWFKLDSVLQKNGLYDRPRDHLFYLLTGSMVGPELASKFMTFCTEYKSKVITPEDVLTNWNKAREHLIKNAGIGVIPNDKFMELQDKLVDFIKANKLTDIQAVNLAIFMCDAPPEIRMAFNSAATKIPTNVMMIQRYAREIIVASTNVQNSDLKETRARLCTKFDELSKDAKANATTPAAPAVRGAKQSK